MTASCFFFVLYCGFILETVVKDKGYVILMQKKCSLSSYNHTTLPTYSTKGSKTKKLLSCPLSSFYFAAQISPKRRNPTEEEFHKKHKGIQITPPPKKSFSLFSSKNIAVLCIYCHCFLQKNFCPRRKLKVPTTWSYHITFVCSCFPRKSLAFQKDRSIAL